MNYALVCDQPYSTDELTGATVCLGTESQMVIDPLTAFDPVTGGEYIAGGFALGLMVFSMTYGVRQVLTMIKRGI